MNRFDADDRIINAEPSTVQYTVMVCNESSELVRHLVCGPKCQSHKEEKGKITTDVTMIDKNAVSIIICFYERLRYLKCCLDSLVGASNSFNEVIVTDDGSSSHTVRQVKDLISHYPFSTRHVWQPKEGFRVAAARNNGVRAAKGDYFIFLDSDFIVLPDTIQTHLSVARPRRFLSGYCKYLSEPQTQQLFAKGLKKVDLEKLYNCLPEDNLKHDHFKFVTRTWRIRLGIASPRKQTLGGHFSIYRSDFESLNGYDEKFVGWGGEDIDLGIRLAASGVYGRSVIRSARVLHMWHTREKNSDDWKKGDNISYSKRQRIKLVCDSGLEQLTKGKQSSRHPPQSC